MYEDVVVLVGPDEPQDVGMSEILQKFELLSRPEFVEGPRTVQDLDGHALGLRKAAGKSKDSNMSKPFKVSTVGMKLQLASL